MIPNIIEILKNSSANPNPTGNSVKIASAIFLRNFIKTLIIKK